MKKIYKLTEPEIYIYRICFQDLKPRIQCSTKYKSIQKSKRSHLNRVAAFIHQIYRVPSIKILHHTSVRRRRKTVRQQLAETKGFYGTSSGITKASNMAAGQAPRQLNTAEIAARGAASTYHPAQGAKMAD